MLRITPFPHNIVKIVGKKGAVGPTLLPARHCHHQKNKERNYCLHNFILWPPSQLSPASNGFQLLTLPVSTQIILFHPSAGPKSAIPLALLSQGFHTTTSPNSSLVISYRGRLFSFTVTTSERAGEYTRSTSEEMVMGALEAAVCWAPVTLST